MDRGESRSREKSLHSADAKAHSTVTFHYPSRALSLVRDRAKLMDSSFFSPPPAPLITPLTHALDLLIVVFLPSFVGRLPRPINSPNAIPSFCSVSRGFQRVAFFVQRNAIGFRSRKTGNCWKIHRDRCSSPGCAREQRSHRCYTFLLVLFVVSSVSTWKIVIKTRRFISSSIIVF